MASWVETKTMDDHVKRLMEQTGCSRAQAVCTLARMGRRQRRTYESLLGITQPKETP